MNLVKRRTQWNNIGLIALPLLLAPSGAVHGQQLTGSVQGTVTDLQGNIFPGARLELINEATNVTLTQSSSPRGTYVFNFVDPGKHTLRVSAESFKASVTRGVLVELNKTTPVDVQLELGGVSEEIVVEASKQAIDNVSATVATNIDKRLVTELPTLHRNVLSLGAMAPGVEMDFGNTLLDNFGGTGQVINVQGSYARVNGNRRGRNAFFLDGADNTAPYRNGGLQFPNPDAIAEFQIATANTSVEFGKQPGAAFNVLIKSGTNEFHGSGSYFFRNSGLNANDPVRKTNGLPRAEEKWRQFGGTLGGPIRKDRTFFFSSFMVYRDESFDFAQPRFPTAAMRSGDFSALPIQLKDPDTKQSLPGNIIPARLLDPVGRGLADLMPTVDTYPERFQWFFTKPSRNQEGLLKLDHHFNGAHSVQATLFRVWGASEEPNGNGNEIPNWGPLLLDNTQTTTSLKHTWVASGSVIVESRINYMRKDTDSSNAVIGQNISDFGARWPIPQESARKYLPQLQLSDGPLGRMGFLRLLNQENLRFMSSLTWVKGSHNVKFGAEVSRDRILQKKDQDDGRWLFDGRFSNGGVIPDKDVFAYAFADLMMGRVRSFQTFGLLNYDLSNWNNFFYVQDQWRVSAKLTITPGIRYEFYTPAKERDNKMSAFAEGNRSTVFPNAPLHLAFPGDDDVPDGFTKPDYNNIAPRLSVVYDVNGDGRMAVRSGVGLYYSHDPLQSKIFAAEAPPWRPSASGADALLSDPWLTSESPVYTQPPTPFSNDSIANFSWPARIPAIPGYDPNFKTPYSIQWNVSVEREIVKGIAMEAAYVGNRVNHLPVLVPLNYARFAPGANDTAANRNSRRPFSQFENVSVISTIAKSWFDSLQLSARLRRGPLSARMSYTFADSEDLESMDLTGLNVSIARPEPGDLGLERGPADLSVRHSFRTFFVYELPFLRNGDSLLHKTLGGWQVSGFFQIRSGQPLNVTLGQDWNYDGLAFDRPDLVGDITYPKTPGVSPTGGTQWFDTSVFELPGGGTEHDTFGTLPRNALVGPSQWTADLALLKNFTLAEGRAVQVRAEAFNVFNHSTLDPTFTTTDFRSADFGKITTLRGARRMQWAVKLIF